LSNGVHALLQELPQKGPLVKKTSSASSILFSAHTVQVKREEEHMQEPTTAPPTVPLQRGTSEPQNSPPPPPAFAPAQDPASFPSAAGPPPSPVGFSYPSNNPFDGVTDSGLQSEQTQNGISAEAANNNTYTNFAAKLAAFENTGRDSGTRTDSGGALRAAPKVDIKFIGNTRIVTDQQQPQQQQRWV
jgi:hypothetical protein